MDVSNPWYTVNNIGEIDTPALIIFPDRVKHNIDAAIKMVEGDTNRLRPHVKTNKCPEATSVMLNAGISQFKCATIAEAEMLAMTGANDVLLAYQPTGPKLQRLLQLSQQYPVVTFSCLVDNRESASAMASHFERAGKRLPVYLDIEVGMKRTGVPIREAVGLYRYIKDLPGIRVGGLHAYDGHIRDADFAKRTQRCDAVYDEVQQLNNNINSPGGPLPVVIGGSPTFSVHCHRKDVQCSPGTFIYWDKGYLDACPEQPFLPACVVATRIISLPAPGRVCTDLGHKSVAAENDVDHRVFFPNTPGLRPVAQSEEHLVLQNDSTTPFHPGDVLYGLPYHICPTIALYETAFTASNGKIDGLWHHIARNRKINV